MFNKIRKTIAAAFMGCVAAAMFWAGGGVVRPAHAAEIVNVEYIVGFVKNKWDVDVPYEEEEIHWAANVEYLLKVVDYVNGKLNNGEKTNYGESEYATKEVVDTIAANQAIRTLIKKKDTGCPANTFCFTPAESNGNEFKFWIGAKGTFYIDWGDGRIDTIEKTEFGLQEISHEYADAAANHTIKLSGRATEYAPPMAGLDLNSLAIVFVDVNEGTMMELSSIDGCLGCVFPTLANGAQPVFYGTFMEQQQLKTLPSTLFNGITGAGSPAMFYGTFMGCVGLESVPDKLFGELSGAPAMYMFTETFSGCAGLESIPENLFAGIQGAPAEAMFSTTFHGCSGLTGPIPEKLFAGIQGAPAADMFSSTFSGCSGLTGPIPEKLFAGIQGAPAEGMFSTTFMNCSGLESIPEHLFDGIDTSGKYRNAMFGETFLNCTSLTGSSARINGKYLYEIWPDAYLQYTYEYATGLSDYDCIPYDWGGPGKKNPGECPLPETE